MSKVQLHAYTLVVLLGIATLGAKMAKPLGVGGRPSTDFSRIPLELAGWSGRDGEFDEQTYRLLPSCSLLLRYYEREDYPPVELAIVYGTNLGDFHQPEICLEGQGQHSVKKSKVRIKKNDGTSFEGVSLIMESGYGRSVYVFWFFSEGATSTFLGNYKLKVFLDRLHAGKVRPSAMVRLSTPVYYSDEEAVDQLIRFAEDFVPYIEEEFAGRD